LHPYEIPSKPFHTVDNPYTSHDPPLIPYQALKNSSSPPP
jgi:hypothetical protein